jgi:hypothetical protein
VAMDWSPYFSHGLQVHMNDLTSLDCNLYIGMPSTQVIDLPRYGSRADRVCIIPRHPHGGVGCDVRYKWTWMCCHTFQISCGYTRKVSQAWDVTHTLGCPPSMSLTTKAMGQDFAGFANHQTIPREVCVLI